MHAAVVERIGEPPRYGHAPAPSPGEGQALVDVSAAPLNPIDLSIAGGRFFAGAPDVPYVPGREGVGTVVEGRSLEPGARVWFPAPGGLGGNGALAERTAAEESEAIPVPGGLDDAVAACLGIAGMTPWLALEWRAGLEAGETVLVLGASGSVGQFAVQAARLLGAGRVVAAARDPGGLERARELGADTVVALEDGVAAGDLAARIREAAGGSVDVVIDPLWGVPAAAALEAMGQGGRLVQIGQSASPEASLTSATVRGRSLSILGLILFAVPREARADAYRRLAEHAVAGRIEVDHETLPLADVAEAWRRQAGHPGRKLVLRP